MERVTVVVTLIVTVTVAIISAISLALLVFYCRRVKVNSTVLFADFARLLLQMNVNFFCVSSRYIYLTGYPIVNNNSFPCRKIPI